MNMLFNTVLRENEKCVSLKTQRTFWPTQYIPTEKEILFGWAYYIIPQYDTERTCSLSFIYIKVLNYFHNISHKNKRNEPKFLIR